MIIKDRFQLDHLPSHIKKVLRSMDNRDFISKIQKLIKGRKAKYNVIQLTNNEQLLRKRYWGSEFSDFFGIDQITNRNFPIYQ